jgi:acetylornithine deacetylase/succinyl-diaminopimelate desuccinylase-like protein
VPRISRGFLLTIALIAAAAGGVFIYVNSTKANDPAVLRLVPPETPVTPEIELLRDYLRIDTSNPPGNELEGAIFLRDVLRRHGVEAELIETDPGRAAVYARIRGRERGNGLMLTHHIDVAPVHDPGEWQLPPFGGEIRNNYLWGRGALDMKGIGICHLVAFTRIAGSGREPRRDLVFLAVPDEETGGERGMKLLIERRPDIFEGVRYAVNEGGITEMRGGEVTYFAVEIGTKQIARFEIESSSREELEKARLAVAPLATPPDPHRITPEVRNYFRAIAERRVEMRELLHDVDRTVAEGEFWRIHQNYRALTQNKVAAFGIAEIGGRYTMPLIAELLVDEEASTTAAEIARLIEPFDVELRLLHAMEPSRYSEWPNAFTEIIVSAAIDHLGAEAAGPLVLGNATNDSRYLRRIGIEAYGFWPYPVDFYQSQSLHGTDESVRLDRFLRGVRMTEELVERYANGDDF